ncbi:MAG: type II toxin-antitoxin system ParD family antitoxin, partial [Verrucomicrobia bacterium]|nr:type II toxin-antitoxin system ParD family antitoxin [Verrucomicrobiota bacterium]
MTTLPITMKEEHQDFIVSAVSSGSYLTQSEVVAAALDLLKAREALRHNRRQELRKEIQNGIDQLERGETS